MPIRAHCGNILGRFRDDVRNFESITWFHVEMNSYNAMFHKRTNKKSKVGIFFFHFVFQVMDFKLCSQFNLPPFKRTKQTAQTKREMLNNAHTIFFIFIFFNCVPLVAPCASLFSMLGQQHCMCLSLQCPSCCTAIGSFSWV